jgi:hypothetical protein
MLRTETYPIKDTARASEDDSPPKAHCAGRHIRTNFLVTIPYQKPVTADRTDSSDGLHQRGETHVPTKWSR